jgi:hypothetical protein
LTFANTFFSSNIVLTHLLKWPVWSDFKKKISVGNFYSFSTADFYQMAIF